MNGKTTVLIIILVLLGIAGGYYLGTNYKLTLQPQTAVSVTGIPTPTQSMEVAPSNGTQSAVITTPAQTTVSGQPVDDSAALIAAIKAGLVAEHGPDASTMTITVGKIAGNFAEGGAAASAGGGMWLAAKVNGTWHLVWDGNGSVLCSSVNPYNFPASMVQECWDDVKQVNVTR
jgi:hypothetical protein